MVKNGQIKIDVLNIFGSDSVIVESARTSYNGESKGEVKDKKLLNYLYTHQHTSPFEMASMRFRIEAPMIVWWQLVRHRTGKFNLQSGRYTELEDKFYIPKEWRGQHETNKQMSDGGFSVEENQTFNSAYLHFLNNAYSLYETFLASGISREMARLVLPPTIFYTGIVSFDINNLIKFLNLRLPEEAQQETRIVAYYMFRHFEKAFPWTYEAYMNSKSNEFHEQIALLAEDIKNAME